MTYRLRSHPGIHRPVVCLDTFDATLLAVEEGGQNLRFKDTKNRTFRMSPTIGTRYANWFLKGAVHFWVNVDGGCL